MGLISFLCRSNLKVVDPHSLNPREVAPLGRVRSTIESSDSGSETNEFRTAEAVYPEAVRFDHQLDISFISTVESYKRELFKDSSIFKGAEKDIIVTEYISPTILSKFEESFESSQCFAFVCFKSKTDDVLWVIRKCLMSETMHSNLALGKYKWSDYSGKEFKLYGGGEVRKIDDKWSLYPKTGSFSKGGSLEIENLDKNVENLAFINGLYFIPFPILEERDQSAELDWMPSKEILEKSGLICVKKLLEIAIKGEVYERNIMDGLTDNMRVWNYEQDVIQSEHVKSWQQLNLGDEFLENCLNEIISPTMDFHACNGILKYALYEIKTNYVK